MQDCGIKINNKKYKENKNQIAKVSQKNIQSMFSQWKNG